MSLCDLEFPVRKVERCFTNPKPCRMWSIHDLVTFMAGLGFVPLSRNERLGNSLSWPFGTFGSSQKYRKDVASLQAFKLAIHTKLQIPLQLSRCGS